MPVHGMRLLTAGANRPLRGFNCSREDASFLLQQSEDFTRLSSGDKVAEPLFIETRKLGKFDHINPPLTRLALTDIRLGSGEKTGRLRLRQPGVAPCVFKPIEEPTVRVGVKTSGRSAHRSNPPGSLYSLSG